MSIFQSHKAIIARPEPVGDVQRVVSYDKEGNEVVTYQAVDYKKLVAENGTAADWSLTSLLKAGINPDFSIHTGSVSKGEYQSQIDSAIAALDAEVSNEAPAEE